MLNNKINKPPPHQHNTSHINVNDALTYNYYASNQYQHDITLPQLQSTLKQNPSFISSATLPSLLASSFHRNDQHMLAYILSLTSQYKEYDILYKHFMFKCCEHGKTELINTLLRSKSNVDINAQNDNGDTPLHVVCYKGTVDCVKEVMKYHPLKHIKNNNGLTAYDCAVESGNKDVIALMKYEADVNGRRCCYFNERDNLEKSVDCQGYAVIVNKKQNDNNKVQEILVEESDYTVSGVVDNNEGDDSSSNNADNEDTDNDDRVKIIQSGGNFNSYSCNNKNKKNVSVSMQFHKGSNKCGEYEEQQQHQLHSPLRNRTSPNVNNGLFTFNYSQNKDELINELQQNDNFNFSTSNNNKYQSIKSIQHSSILKKEDSNYININININKDLISNTHSFSKSPHNVCISESLAKINKLPSSLIYTPSKQKPKSKINSNSYTSSTTAAIHNNNNNNNNKQRFNTSSDIFTSSDINVRLSNSNNNNNNLINSSRNLKPKQPISQIISSSLPDSSITLYSFLKEIELQSYTDTLCMNGFDDIGLIIEQTKSDLAMTDKNLKDIGINLIGDRAKILVRLEEKAMLFPFTLEKEKVYYHSTRNRNTLLRLLSAIKLESFIDSFVNAGYPSADLLIVQMLSRQPLNDVQLEREIGIEKIGYRMRIIHKLKSEAAVYGTRIRKSAVIFETRKQENEEFCNLCNVF